ncbi:hypothetical protein ACXC9Q_28730 [Kribbella sp. CWNU-51]
MNRRPPDPNSVPTIAERRRLLEVNRASAKFFRRELLQAKKGWARDHLMRAGAGELVDPSSAWSVGYAPDAGSRLVDHLRARGFNLESVRNAGLGLLNPEGRTVDRFRDQVIFAARNDELQTVGFVGVRASTSPYYATSPATQVHRRSNCLVGVAEQLDLLSEGAVPVLVNDPLDAVAIERISRLTVGRWAGIPLCDSLLSAEQARIFGRYAATDSAIVVLKDRADGQRAAIGVLDDLSRFFPRVWAVELPVSPTTLSRSTDGRQRLHDDLLLTRPLADYRSRRGRQRQPSALQVPDLEPHGPAL